MSTRPAFGATGTTTTGQKVRRRIGALWTKVSRETAEQFQVGEIVFTPELQEALTTATTDKFGNKIVKVSVFNNSDKTESNHPDYRILLSRNQGNGLV